MTSSTDKGDLGGRCAECSCQDVRPRPFEPFHYVITAHRLIALHATPLLGLLGFRPFGRRLRNFLHPKEQRHAFALSLMA